MNKKNGFTLVELLAVIAVLAILVVLSVPNIIKLFNESKKKSFLNEAKTVYREVSKKYLTDSIKDTKIERIRSNDEKTKLSLESNNLVYDIKIDAKGSIEYFMVTNGEYCISGEYRNIIDLDLSTIKNEACEIGKDDEPIEPVEPDEPEIVVPVINCAYDGTLKRGIEFVSGAYTYRYMQQGSSGSTRLTWENINIDGWGVQLTNKENKNPIKSQVCTNIGGKPIVSMKYMFYASESTSIDLSTIKNEACEIGKDDEPIEPVEPDEPEIVVPVINCAYDGTLKRGIEFVSGAYTYRYMQQGSSGSTRLTWENINIDGWGVQLTNKENKNPIKSQVCTNIGGKPIVSMKYMFYASESTSIDLSSFNTDNVKDMGAMFSYTNFTNIDLSTFNTKNVETMYGMFYGAVAKKIDVTGFNTSKVTDMSWMFSSTNIEELDLNKFNTSNVTNMYGMFSSTKIKDLNLTSFNTSKVKNMEQMFLDAKSTTIDLSSFDISSVTNNRDMFSNCSANTVYAKNNNDINWFKRSGRIPWNLKFVIK